MTKNIKNYSELIQISSYIERYKYLRLYGSIGEDTFGFDRYINQSFYKSKEWRNIRNHIIARDYGCDMAFPGYEISGQILIHHMNPITAKDIYKSSDFLLNPEYLICVSKNTHNAIHYGSEKLLLDVSQMERSPNDTLLWRKQ